jgi:hypothetical protein
MPYIVTLYDKNTKIKVLIGICKKYSTTDILKYDLYNSLDKTSYDEIKKNFIINTYFINNEIHKKLVNYVDSELIKNKNINDINLNINMSKFESSYFNPILYDDKISEICKDSVNLIHLSEISIE